MFPILISVGAFQFQTIWLFVVLAVLAFAYVVFLQTEDQVLPTHKIFDLIVISVISGLVLGKFIETFLRLGELDFVGLIKFWQTPNVNFFTASLASLATLFYLSRKFKLSEVLIIDVVSLATIPALAIFYFGKLLSYDSQPITIFGVVWFLTATLFFAKSAKKIQFPSFYLLLAACVISVYQIVFGVFQSEPATVRTFNLTISSLILTIAVILFYKNTNRDIFEDLKMIGEKTLEKIKKILLRRRKTLETELANLKKDDPFLAEGREQSRESGEDAYEFEGHERITVVAEELKKALFQVRKALSAVGLGKYGKCEHCGKDIEERRLKVLPQATLCFSCEREVEKKRAG